MEDATKRFRNLLEQTLIPGYCSINSRGMNSSGFRASRTPLSTIDMADFLRGWDAQLLPHDGNGRYRAPRGGASEVFFWEGLKANTPRTFTLWIEPIITLAVLARMHLDFAWPKTLIGNQLKGNWAFDVVGYKSESDPSILIACEVKKSRKEIDALISHMQCFGRQASLSGEQLKGAEKNAFKKVKALRECNPSIFWAVGPERYEKAFSVQYGEGGVIEFCPISSQVLMHKGD
jgi:hypothetical protein